MALSLTRSTAQADGLSQTSFKPPQLLTRLERFSDGGLPDKNTEPLKSVPETTNTEGQIFDCVICFMYAQQAYGT